MPKPTPATPFAAAARATLAVLAATTTLAAQQLALHNYSVRDGLAHSHVNCLLQDHRGFLWIGTWEGLSRFDGREFVTYGTPDGLPNPFVSCVAEDRDGNLWVGTLGGGVARMRERARADGNKFEAWSVADQPRANDVNALLFDGNGRLWIGTAAGIYAATIADGRASITSAQPLQHDCVVGVVGAHGPVFFTDQVVAVVREGRLRPLPFAVDATGGGTVDVLATGDDFLLARDRELLQVSLRDDVPTWQAVPVPLRADERITHLLHGPGDELWVATRQGLLERRGAIWQRFDNRHGLPDAWVHTLLADDDGTLWIGTHRGGLTRLGDRAVVTFGPREGFAENGIARVIESPDHRLYAASDLAGVYEVLDDRVARVPGSDVLPFANVNVRLECDDDGVFWLGTNAGLYRCDGPELDMRRAVRVGLGDGLPEGRVVAVQLDARRRLWVSFDDRSLYCRERGATAFHGITALAATTDSTPCRAVLAEPDGSTLLGTFDRLWRLHGDHCTEVRPGDDDPVRPRSLCRDRSGGLWIGTRFLGLFGLGNGQGPRRLTSGNGLGSDAVWDIVEDRRGRLLLATARGLRSIDGNGMVHTFASGQVEDLVNDLLLAHDDRLWAATAAGLARVDLDSRAREPAPPRAYLTRVRVGGEAIAVPENGTVRFDELELAPPLHDLEVEFVGVQLGGDRSVRFEHQLLGVDTDWSQPTETGALRFAQLAAGSYRLRIRAIDADGRTSQPAELLFAVLPPFWQRAWFVTAVAALGLGVTVLWHRARLRRAVATERLRTQIATDLHDEVGAGLAQIAILSEVARRDAAPAVAADIGEVARLARGLRETMSDIVWALARGHDSLADLVQRMRQLGERMLEVDGTQVQFQAPAQEALSRVVLSLDQRRQLWLWFKEALANLARHAEAGSATIDLALAEGTLRLEVRDDGVGFDPARAGDGNGLTSMRARAQRLAGRMELHSAPGAGARLLLEVPVRSGRRHPG